MRSERRGHATPKTQGQSQNPMLAHEEIAGRAYQRYLDRGATDGLDIDDWLAAECELARERTDRQSPRRSSVPDPEAA